MNDQHRKKRDYLFVYMMILALILFVIGFYLGGVVVKNKYLEQINYILEQKNAENIEGNYLLTDFATFYYGVLEPFNHLKSAHFAYVDQIRAKDSNMDYKAKSRELLEQSRNVLEQIESTPISSTAPLLIESKNAFSESLRSYKNGISALLNEKSLPEEIEKFTENWLKAQRLFYKSVVEWEQIYAHDQIIIDLDEEQDMYYLSIQEWNRLSLHQKNLAISILMEQRPYVIPYQPEDITIHLDALAQSTNIENLNLSNIGNALDLFIASKAINFGDFHKDKDLYYKNVKTPLIPLY